MDAVAVPFLPTGLWLLSTAGCIAIVLVVFSMYWYHRRRFRAVIADSRHAAELAARKEQLQADVQALRNWIKELKDELARLQSEREEHERLRGELSRLQNECATADQRLIDSRKEAGELESQRHIATQTVEKLNQEIDELKGQRLTLEDLQGQIAAAENSLNAVRTELNAARNETDSLIRKGAELRIESDVMQRRLEELREELKRESVESEHAASIIMQKREEINGVSERLEEIRREAANLSRQAAESRIELGAVQNRHHQFGQEIARLKIQHDSLVGENQKLEKVRADVGEATRLLGATREKVHEAEQAVLRLQAEKAALERDIGKLSGHTGKDEEDSAYADLLQNPPRCLDRSLLPMKKFPHEDEERALADVRARLEGAGYQFHERVIKAFHTALKCHDINPLTVLAGVSGTGKTLLPTAYANLMGMHSLVIAVQPRWDSPQDIFGFYNYLEKRYKATDLARALIRMDPFNTVEGLDESQKRQDRMLLVLLDEMNLARTEYYFSEFLSKLELRRLTGPPQNPENRQHAEICLDIGPGRKPISFWVSDNVLFTGTMNEDETTQTLSDKVVDRANVLRFGRPARRTVEGQQDNLDRALPPPPGYLPVTQWKRWCRSVQDAGWTQKVVEWIDGLNDALTKVGRPFGHRVRKSILTYVANYPGVGSNDAIFKEAFADQIEQKILPKLRGLDTLEGGNNAAFDDIGRIIEGTGDEGLVKAYGNARENNATGMFLWQGVTR